MIAERTVLAAVERGILSAEQADRLRALEATLAAEPLPFDGVASAPSHDDEQLRFITGFGDIFVTIGLVLFLGAFGYFADAMLGATGLWIALAAASWLLAEYFTRRRRMALPSIVLLLVFAGSVMTAGIHLLGGEAGAMRIWLPGQLPEDAGALPVFGAGLLTIGATVLHYWRFRVPITVAAGAAALVASAIGLAVALFPSLFETTPRPLLVACGIGVFALAMWFDTSDPQRRTRRADIAFWLHLLAAPLIVHPLLSTLSEGIEAGTAGGLAGAAPVLVAFLLLGAVAVLIDRRALLVSGLLYAGYAFGSLIRDTGLSGVETPLTLLALGALVLLLSAAWHPLRRAILSHLPPGLARRLPQP